MSLRIIALKAAEGRKLSELTTAQQLLQHNFGGIDEWVAAQLWYLTLSATRYLNN